MTDAPIVMRGLVKTFGSTRALDGLDLTVAAGEVHGFLGPNGAGKSTTIRILLGLLRATGGEARLLGADPWREAAALHRRLAYVPGDVVLWPELTGGETIDLLGRLRGALDPGRRDRLVRRFELDETKRAKTYSKGNRQKVALVAALAAGAELLVLDEPTSGLDPLMEQAFQRSVAEERDRGATIVLSSHILGEVERLCDRVTIVRDGRSVRTGTLDELRDGSRTTVDARTRSRPTGLDAVDGVADLRLEDHRVRLSVPDAGVDAVVARLHAAGLARLEARPPTLDELFLSEYERTAQA